jgi:hypothetical protein
MGMAKAAIAPGNCRARRGLFHLDVPEVSGIELRDSFGSSGLAISTNPKPFD